jgi:hypothetical protein
MVLLSQEKREILFNDISSEVREEFENTDLDWESKSLYEIILESKDLLRAG